MQDLPGKGSGFRTCSPGWVSSNSYQIIQASLIGRQGQPVYLLYLLPRAHGVLAGRPSTENELDSTSIVPGRNPLGATIAHFVDDLLKRFGFRSPLETEPL